MRATTTLILAILLLTGASCQLDYQLGPKSDPPPPKPTTMPGVTSAPTSPKSVVLLVRYRLLGIEVPVGSVSGSEELWSYLDEEGISVERSSVLGRNGLRIGRANPNHWTDIANILTRLTGRALEESAGVFLPGQPHSISVRQAQPIQTIFVSNSDRTIVGQDYPEGDNVITLCCTLNQDDPSMIMVTGVPQVRSTQRHWRIVERDGRLSMENAPLVFSIDPLTFRIPMASKDVLVIGPGSESRRPYSLGRHFLTRQREGIDFETVIVLIPEVLAQPREAAQP